MLDDNLRKCQSLSSEGSKHVLIPNLLFSEFCRFIAEFFRISILVDRFKMSGRSFKFDHNFNLTLFHNGVGYSKYQHIIPSSGEVKKETKIKNEELFKHISIESETLSLKWKYRFISTFSLFTP
ncbi:hypothetical protein BpHYR1_054063 [Brachionus plicatilis]|uniref:Uncharacterized protein n=1 Tax=Brachionus plicatilis TaxID=10195 RepID=A0A3M7RC69_BRAPC|nr:hypothetical protein BpHYR1_054063 [Brachionus plicatilis]